VRRNLGSVTSDLGTDPESPLRSGPAGGDRQDAPTPREGEARPEVVSACGSCI
jgi:hypothetical protein